MAALVPGHVVWVRAKDPTQSTIYFEFDSMELRADARLQVEEIGRNAADWSFVLQGGYSAEGTLEHNWSLAVARAQQVSQVLQSAGVPRDRIVYLQPPPPDPNRSLEEQRTCRIFPVAPMSEEVSP